MANKYYITTTLPYVNAKPHIGFGLEILQADVLARYHRLLGEKVFFNTGTDEHGVKIYRKALENNQTPQEYTDEWAKKFNTLKQALNLSYDKFIRTTDEKHKKAAQEFWKRCLEAGDIYKKEYKVKYCVGCELEKTDSELDEGKCPIHPNLEIETIEEENYFFKFSKYEKKLLALYKDRPDLVVPRFRLKEIETFVKGGLKDFSVSRLKEKMPWGIPVPGDETQVMYVWFDALINYISTLGWPEMSDFDGFWPGVQVAGKDNLRQQSAIWQAMLMSASFPNSKQIMIHGFITSGGAKMSKSLGNVIDPIEVANKYGVDALRYYLLAKVHPFKDSDFTIENFEEVYNSDLANGLGNLTSRVLTMAEKFTKGVAPKTSKNIDDHPLQKIEKNMWQEISRHLDKYEFHLALDKIWDLIHKMDKYIDENKPWELAKQAKQEEVDWIVGGLVETLKDIAWLLLPFLPETSKKIGESLKSKEILEKQPNFKNSWTNVKAGDKINKIESLFPRI